MIIKGFRFGLFLQFAVGPVCVLIFNLACNGGIFNGILAVTGVTIIDALYIILAIIGISRLLDLKKHQRMIGIIGAIIILLFSADIIIKTVSGFSIFPTFSIATGKGTAFGGFLQAIFITISNPITILFWSGVFSLKISEDNMNKTDIIKFGVGAILSTFIFLTLISITGVLFHSFLSEKLMKLLNIIIGIALAYFAVLKLSQNRFKHDNTDESI